MIKQLLSYLQQYKKYVFITPILVGIETILELLLPSIMADIVDSGISQAAAGDNGLLWKLGLEMSAIAVVCVFIGIAAAKTSSVGSQGYGSNLRVALYSKIQEFSFADVDRFSTASLITRTVNDVRQVQQIVMQVLRTLVRAPARLVIALCIVMTYNAKLTLIYFVAMPILFAVVYTLMKISHHMFRILQEKVDAVNAVVQENLIAIRVVKAFVRADYEKEKFRVSNDDLKDWNIKAMGIMILNRPLSAFVLNCATLAIYWFGGRMVGNQELLSGELIAVISYLGDIMMSITMFSNIIMRLNRARASAERICEVLNAEPDIQDPEGIDRNARTAINGDVEFRDVSFRYLSTGTGEDVLSHISFTAKKGQTIAIIGGTGSGKSSLVNMIPRFYDADEGEVFVDGKNVKEYDLTNLRKSIGMVLQKNVLFSGTIRDNMRWGKIDATDEEIITALKEAQAYDFVMEMPDGLDTMIMQGGTNVSGGQRQRLCIARAMIKRPSILILDDSTSAVDSDTESRIRESFYTGHKDCTIFIIAQRISSVVNADKIIVIDEGKIESIGSHAELMKISPIYQEIYTSQLEGGKLE